ncbi:hypothetical protein [Ignatzschineria sp. LJL83]
MKKNIAIEFSKDLQIIFDSGLSIEMQVFLNSLKDEKIIKDFDFFTKPKGYFIDVFVKEYDKYIVEDLFLSFVKWIEYSYFTFYTKEYNVDSSSYQIISGLSDLIAFNCMISFRKN